jgi:hypothetical protein
MANGQGYYGSICVTDLLEKLKEKHSSFSKSAKNGKIYANVGVWVNDVMDEYGNHASLKLNPSKEKKDIEKGFYIGNFKKSQSNDRPVSDRDSNFDVSSVDIPVSGSASSGSDISDVGSDGLPF